LKVGTPWAFAAVLSGSRGEGDTMPELPGRDTKNRLVGMATCILAGLCVCSCGAKPDARPSQQSDPGSPPSEGGVTASAVSQFIGEVGKEKHEEAPPPAEAPVLRWDFSKADVEHAYVFEQEVRSKSDMGASFGGGSRDMGQEMSAKGTLLVRSKGEGVASLVLKDMKMSMKMRIGGDEEPKTMEQTAPPVVVQGMKEDGSGSFGNSSQDMFLKMLFPLPSGPLAVGEFDDVPAQMPFNAMGSVLEVKGRSRITLARYVTIGGRKCAQLDVDTDISTLDVPPELEGEYVCSTRGTSVFYFDVANRSFVSGTIALIMQIRIDAPMPRMTIPGGDAPEMPKRTRMSMVNDNLIRVELKE